MPIDTVGVWVKCRSDRGTGGITSIKTMIRGGPLTFSHLLAGVQVALGNVPRGVCLNPRLHYKCTFPRLPVELPPTIQFPLTNLLLQCLKARQILFVTLVNLAGSFVRGGGFRANQGLRAAAAVGDMREITAVAIDHLMQMLPTLLPHAETMHGLLGVGQECAQLATVATVAGQRGGAAIIRRFDRYLRDACCQLGPTRRQPVGERRGGRG